MALFGSLRAADSDIRKGLREPIVQLVASSPDLGDVGVVLHVAAGTYTDRHEDLFRVGKSNTKSL